MQISFDLKNGFQFLWGKSRYTKTPTPQALHKLTNNVPQTLNPDTWNVFNLFTTTAELYAVITLRGSLLASGKWLHKNKKGETIENSRFVSFLENPNLLMKGNQFLMMLDQSMCLHGQTFEYVLKGFSGQEIPSLINILPPKDVKIKASGKWYKQTKMDEIITGFEYDKDPISIDDMLYTWIPNTENPLIGDSPLKPLHLPISNIRESYNARNAIMVKRGALGILSSNSSDSVGSRGVNSNDRERIEKEYQNSYGMGDDQSNVIITDSSVSWQPMSFPTRDLMLFEEVSADFMRVIDNFGLNINLFSREKGSTYENLSQGLKQAYQTTIIPYGEELAMKYSKLFNLKNGEYLELDYSHIPVLQENEKERSVVLSNKANATQTLVNAGYSLDEVKNIIPL